MENRAGMAPVDGGVPGALDNAVLAAFSGPPDPSRAPVSEVLLVITVVMVILAAANAIFTTWATVLDARRFSAIARSLGATPQQTVAGLSAAQLLLAMAGLAAIPARIGARRPVAEILQSETA
jgi:hypothetical protein